MEDIYKQNGYKNRQDYLDSLSEEFDPDTVEAVSELLGPSEDFDGLISCLEDGSMM